jgi:hypothetical protein
LTFGAILDQLNAHLWYRVALYHFDNTRARAARRRLWTALIGQADRRARDWPFRYGKGYEKARKK